MSRGLAARSFLAASALLCAAGCAAINRQVDHWAMQGKAGLVVGQGPAERVEVALPYRAGADLERLTRPRGVPEVAAGPLGRHRLANPLLVQEELRFASAIKLRFPEADEAKVRVFRHGRLGERPVLLYVPGQNFAEGDFPALEPFFDRALERGFDVVFFVPPYHLDRTPRGYGSGDALLATEFVDHLMAFAQELSDLRALCAWLRGQGVEDLGAYGGSMGGGMVLRLIGWEPLFDFVGAMQPVLDWNALLLRPEMAPVRARLKEQGYGDEDVAAAYGALDPRTEVPKVAPARISLLYGRFDLIAPPEPVLSLARQWGVTRVRACDRGHALLSFGPRLVREMADALEEDLAALRLRRSLRN